MPDAARAGVENVVAVSGAGKLVVEAEAEVAVAMDILGGVFRAVFALACLRAFTQALASLVRCACRNNCCIPRLIQPFAFSMSRTKSFTSSGKSYILRYPLAHISVKASDPAFSFRRVFAKGGLSSELRR